MGSQGNSNSTGIRNGSRRAALAAHLLATTALLGFTYALQPAPAVAQTASEAGQARAFNIPAQPLAGALSAFGRQSGLQITMASSTSRGVTSRAVNGSYTPQQALSLMLEGTGIAFSIGLDRTAYIGQQETVESVAIEADGSLVLDVIEISGKGDRLASSGSGYQGTPDWVYETPSSVSVVSGEAIQSSGARNVRDAIASAPGVYSGEGQGSFPTVSPNIRGVSDSGRVVVSIDGARQNAQEGGRYGGGLGGFGAAFVDSAFIRQVDINKNPDATAGNAGSLGGGVNFRTVGADDIIQPGREWGVEFNGTAGTNAHDYSGSVIAATRIGEYFSLTAGISKAKLGNYKIGSHGEVTTPDFDDLTGRKTWSSLLKLEGDLGDVRTSLSWMHQQNDFGYTPSGGSNAGSTFDATNDSVSASVEWNPDNPLINTKAIFWLNNSSQDEVREARIINGISYAPETFQQRNLLSFGGTLENTSEFDTAAGPLTFNYGVEAFRDDASSHVMNENIAEDPRFASGYMQFNRPGQRDVASTFINGKWEPADWVTLSGGLRYDWYRLEGTSTYYNHVPASNYPASCVMTQYDYLVIYNPDWLPAASDAAIRRAQRTCGEVYNGNFYQEGRAIPELSTPITYPATKIDIDRTDSAWLPSATVEFKPFDWLRPYVSYSHSFRPPTINEAFHSGGVSPVNGIDVNGAPNEYLRAEKARTWEVGVNVIQDGVFTGEDTFRFKASAFHRTIEDYIVLGYHRVPGVNKNLIGFVNADEDATMYGLELEGNYDAGSYWLGGAATWLETRWPDKTQIFSNEYGSTGGEIFAFAGAVPPRFKVTLDAGIRLFDRKIAVGARVNHVTPNLGRYLDENGNLAETSDPYTTLDLHASFKLGDNAMLNLAVNNVTDQLYVPATGNFIAPGRTFLASVKARF